MVDLLGCPFCDRALEHQPAICLTHHPKMPYGEHCPAQSFGFASDRKDIIASWNTRMPQPVAVAQCSKEMRTALQYARSELSYISKRHGYVSTETAIKVVDDALVASPAQSSWQPSDDELAGWARSWHWNDTALDQPVDPSIYFRDMRMLKAFIEKCRASGLSSTEGK